MSDQTATEPSTQGSTQGVLSRTMLATIGMVVQGLARFVYTLVIGRLAGPEALGDTSALLSVAVYLSLVLPAGLGISASRFLPDPVWAGAAIRQLRSWFWLVSSLLALTAIPIAWWISGSLSSAICCAVLVFGYNAYVFTRGVLMGEDRILRSTVADTISSLIAITALMGVLWFGIDALLLLPLAIGYLIFALFALPKTPTSDVPLTPLQRSTLKKFLRDTTVGALATGGLLPATMVFVRAFDTPEQAGLFAAALSLATPANLVAQAVNQVLVPHFARLRDDPHSLRQSHTKLFLASTAVFTVIFVPLILLSPFILSLLYGEQYADGTAAMQALLLVVFLISVTCGPAAYLVAAGRQQVFATIWLVSFIAGTLTMIIASPAWGMWGALLGFGVGGGLGSIAVVIAGLALAPVSLSLGALDAAPKHHETRQQSEPDTALPSPAERHESS